MELSSPSFRTTSIVVALALSLVACTRTPQSTTERSAPFIAASDPRATVPPQQTETESNRHPATALESGPAESPPSEGVDKEVDALVAVMVAKNPITVRRSKFALNKGADLPLSGAMAFEVTDLRPGASDTPGPPR